MMRKPSSGGTGVPLVLAVLTVVCLVSFAGVSAVVAGTAAEDTGTDAGDTRSNAAAIDDGSTVTDTITASDDDWYAIEFEKGQRFAIRLEVIEDGEGGDEKKDDEENEEDGDEGDDEQKEGSKDKTIRIRLYGPDGKPVTATESGSGGQASLSGVIEHSGTYYVKIDSVEGKKNSEGTPSSYALTVTSRSPTEHASNEKKPPDENSSRVVPIESGETVTGVLTGENGEYFSIEVDAGEVISIETTFEAAPESAGTVFVYAPDGKQIRKSKTGDIRRITTQKGGMYTIKLVSNAGSGKRRYTLTATLTPNRSRKSNDVRHIAAGDVVEDSIASANETDRYAIKLKKGQGFTVLLKHINRKNPSMELSFEVYGPNGNRIGEVPFNRPRRAYQTNPATASAYGGDVVERSGTYHIVVEGTPGANYSLVVNTVKLDKHDPNEQPTSATVIDASSTVSGVLTGYDRDVYSIKLHKNETVTVEYTGFGNRAFPLSLWVAGPSVRGRSAEDYSFGTYTIASSNGDTNGNLTFTANRTGTYYIKVVPDPERSTSSTFFEKVRYELTIHMSKAELLTLNRPTTVAPSTATVTLHRSTATATPTPTPTSTPTPTATSTPTATATTTATQATVTSSSDTPVTTTTATDGPGFGILVALFGLCGGAWWYRSRQ